MRIAAAAVWLGTASGAPVHAHAQAPAAQSAQNAERVVLYYYKV
jgi:hypothetical protein